VEHEAEDRRMALRTCLEQVEGRRRTVLEMRYGANAKVTAIASELNMSCDAVSVMLYRIRRMLYECVQKQLARMEAF
jgi:RNA polymerase sigma-70 factor (ECF subfamily)